MSANKRSDNEELIISMRALREDGYKSFKIFTLVATVAASITLGTIPTGAIIGLIIMAISARLAYSFADSMLEDAKAEKFNKEKYIRNANIVRIVERVGAFMILGSLVLVITLHLLGGL